jgi:hypothetical protein
LEDELLKVLRLFAALALVAQMSVIGSNANPKQPTVPARTSRVHTGAIAATEGAISQPVLATKQSGEVFTHEEAGVQFQLPNGWKAEPDGEQILVHAPDHSFSVVFWVPEEDTFEEAVKALDEELGKTIKKMKTVGKGESDTHNGMAHFTAFGTGEVEGVAINWSVDLLAAKKPLIVLTFVADGKSEKHAADYKKLVMSIKKK